MLLNTLKTKTLLISRIVRKRVPGYALMKLDGPRPLEGLETREHFLRAKGALKTIAQ